MAKKYDMWKAHEISFGQIDPPRVLGGVPIRDGLNYVPRIGANRKIVSIAAFVIGYNNKNQRVVKQVEPTFLDPKKKGFGVIKY